MAKQVFIHLRLSRAYLALARLSCFLLLMAQLAFKQATVRSDSHTVTEHYYFPDHQMPLNKWSVAPSDHRDPGSEASSPVASHTRMRQTRKPSYRWQTRATRKHAKNCSNSTCLQRCRWQYWPIFMRLAAVASEICEIPRNSVKIQTYEVQGHPRSSILVPIESPYVTCY